jgi:hypothetical protein
MIELRRIARMNEKRILFDIGFLVGGLEIFGIESRAFVVLDLKEFFANDAAEAFDSAALNLLH